MILPANSPVAPSAPVAPRPVPDLRPAADAAASARETRPAPAMTVAPPSASQTALVSRSIVTDVTGVEVTVPVRVLKPYGVEMLPHRPEADDAEKGMGRGNPAGQPGTSGETAEGPKPATAHHNPDDSRTPEPATAPVTGKAP